MSRPSPSPARPAQTMPRPGPSPICFKIGQPTPGPGPQYVGPGPARPAKLCTGPARPGLWSKGTNTRTQSRALTHAYTYRVAYFTKTISVMTPSPPISYIVNYYWQSKSMVRHFKQVYLFCGIQ